MRQTIEYHVDGQGFRSRLIAEAGGSDLPMILFAPNWLGMTTDAEDRAAALSRDGYVCMVADMYGDGRVARDHAEAEALSNAVRADHLLRRRRIVAALAAMRQAARDGGPGDPARVAALGYCFGGGNVLELARTGADIRAAVCVHGEFLTPEPVQPGQLQAAILALHGADDPITAKDQRDAFEAEMRAAGADWSMVLFGGGVVHSFCEVEARVPGIAEYHPGAAAQSAVLIRDFIGRALSGPSRD